METTASETVSYLTNSSIFKSHNIEEAIKIPFVNGNYKGKSLSKILETDPSYLLYLLKCNYNREEPPYPGVETLINEFYEKALIDKISAYEFFIINLKDCLKNYRTTGIADYVSL